MRDYIKKNILLRFFRPLKQGNTLVHHIEQINNAKYRYDKRFPTRVYRGNKYIKTGYKAYLRKNVNKKEHFLHLLKF